MSGLYIHIPFCRSRCIYCGFYSTTLLARKARYVEALCREMALRANELKGQTVGTVYVGGGTPSQLSAEELRRLFSGIYNIYKVEDGAEITLECNPDDVDDAFAETLSRLPVNRVSMGAQTFSDDRLRLLCRRHTSQQVGEAVGKLRRAGIRNVSIDLMFGFPGESISDWRHDIEAALALGVEHISAYSLMYEEGTELERLSRSDKRYAPVSEERSLAMYELLIDHLHEAGYEHYEISNFARWTPDGHPLRSRHNSNYWQAVPYVGLGAAAHSYDLISRSWNVANVERYIEAVEHGERPVEEREVLTDDDRFDDMVMTRLRTREGISMAATRREFGPDYERYLMENARRHLDRNLLAMDDDRLHLTRQGLFVSDAVMSDLMHV